MRLEGRTYLCLDCAAFQDYSNGRPHVGLLLCEDACPWEGLRHTLTYNSIVAHSQKKCKRKVIDRVTDLLGFKLQMDPVLTIIRIPLFTRFVNNCLTTY